MQEGATVIDPKRGVFAVSVAAELSGTTVQNLHAYERNGLLKPERTDGGSRRYSHDDIDRLLNIREMLEAGLNTAGIQRVLALEGRISELQRELDVLRHMRP
jgi:MerR family transcriptional regulator/heat shock protein HspR